MLLSPLFNSLKFLLRPKNKWAAWFFSNFLWRQILEKGSHEISTSLIRKVIVSMSSLKHCSGTDSLMAYSHEIS